MNPKIIITTGAVFMALAVALGAFGAHIVQDILTPDRFDVYQTAVEYHFCHALGLLFLGVVTLQVPENKWLSFSGYSLIAGIIIFSGSLYVLTLTDTGWLGAVTPVGGIAFILGWIFLVMGVTRSGIKKA
jgi:uncharacterized membrane protein YgdD (TMEM256/DUF423 family)